MTVIVDPNSLFAMLDIGMLAVRILAVVGGVAVGGYGTGWLIKILSKPLAFKQVPVPLLRASRILGALVVGLIVAAWVFNLGGAGGMGGSGGGWWPFGQSGAGISSSPGPAGSHSSPQPNPEPNAKTFRIHMRGGDTAQRDQRFYILEADPPRTWMELKEVLAEKRKENQALVIAIVIGKKSVDEQNPAVRQLKNWAKENNVAVKMEYES